MVPNVKKSQTLANAGLPYTNTTLTKKLKNVRVLFGEDVEVLFPLIVLPHARIVADSLKEKTIK